MNELINTPSSAEAYQLKEKVTELSDLILSKHPRMPTLLREIHTTLGKYPEQVVLLSEEEIGIIVSGLTVHTKVQFAANAISSAKAPSATKSLKDRVAKLGVDAF
jgi:heterodisulfide reductase subunit B